MARFILLVIAFLIPLVCSSEELPVTSWNPQWNFDPMDDSVSCSMFSDPIFFKGKFGPNKAYIGVQEKGVVTIHTKKDSFDSRYISKFGIRVGANEAIYAPEFVSPSLVRFSEEKSKILTEQLFSTYDFTIQVVFFPDGEIVNKKLHTGIDTKSFQSVLMSKNYCSAIKNNEGWVGITFTDLMGDPTFIEHVKKHSKFSNPGVIVWAVHPKKQGAKSGLVTFDVILGVNSEPINSEALLDKLITMKSKEKITVNILRGKRSKTIELTKP